LRRGSLLLELKGHSGYLRHTESGGGAGILGLLGNNRGGIDNGIAQRTGLDPGAVG